MVSAGDGVRLALHRWTGGAARAAVFYIHGIQSHAGWLRRTGPELARRGVDVYALDRRGSGRSSGPRGHLPSADLVLEDYRRALVRVRHRTRGLPVTAVGQSLGGSVLAALLTQAPAAFDGAVWCAPALGQQRRRHAPERLAQLRVRHGIRPTPVTLSDADYTDEPADLAYMATDNLMLRQITDSTRRVQVEWEDMYMSEKSLTVGGRRISRSPGTTRSSISHVRPMCCKAASPTSRRARSTPLATTSSSHRLARTTGTGSPAAPRSPRAAVRPHDRANLRVRNLGADAPVVPARG